MPSPLVRLAAACCLVSAWLVLLLTGFALGGAIHLLLVAALIAFPWRALGGGATDEGARE